MEVANAFSLTAKQRRRRQAERKNELAEDMGQHSPEWDGREQKQAVYVELDPAVGSWEEKLLLRVILKAEKEKRSGASK